ncbi:hypothetical protein HHI36_012794 [Cryptolaemus montrouzieri]|uniref:Uncharacterized protein n=1 Tax=Cryptolaemus montrouzieri TaxID=559131 RepID=A0ABD2NF98_9CUCU
MESKESKRANVSVMLKKKRINNLRISIDMQKLKDPEVQTKVKQRINKDFAALKEDATDDINVEEGWKQVESKIINIGPEEIGYTNMGYRNPWIT